jgi:release factor glutamine methyltransferase
VSLTISETLGWALEVLSTARVESPRVDAEIIVCHYTSLARAQLYAEPRRRVPDETLSKIRDAVTQRTSGAPVQYVVGESEFLGHRISVGPEVLIPRPETELLALEAIGFLKGALGRRPPWGPPEALAADVGTGSGAIAVALAAELPELKVHATDTSHAAVEVASENVAAAGVESRVILHEGSMTEPLAGGPLEGKFAAVVSNPPYVSEAEWRTLPAVVKDYEPARALLAGPDGLDYIARLISEGPMLLAPGGLLAFEMGAWHWPKVVRLLDAQRRLGCFKVIRDLAGYERIATAIRI